MRALARLTFAWLVMAGGALAAPSAPEAGSAVPGDAARPRIVVAFANEPRTAPGPAGATGSRYGGDGYRISQSAREQARRVAADYALREVASWPIRELSMHCVVFEITNGRPVEAVLAALAHDARVMLAQPLHEFHTHTTPEPAAYNDPLYDLQTNLATLGIARAHQRAQGAGVRIALIDTGVDVRHPDLDGRILHRRSFLGGGGAADAALTRHGTAMAGLIAAVANNHVGIVGIAPLAQLEVFEACWQLAPGNDAAACNTFTLAQALAAALASGARLVNLSIAGPADPLLTALLEHGLKRGVTFVGPVADAHEGFPGSVPGVISAGGNEHALPPGAFAVPSEHVLTLRPDAQYDFVSGSSVAAAEITGVIALLMSASSVRLSSAGVVELLAETPAAAPAPGDPPAVDINAALARLDAGQHRSAVAARASR